MSSTAFSIRPNIHLILNMSQEGIGNNASRVYWNVQIFEVAQQPSYSFITANNSWSVSFSWPAGSHFGGSGFFNYDFRPTGLQTQTLGSGFFDVAHQSNGAGWTVSGSASVSTTVIGSATDGNAIFLSTDYDYNPVWQSISIPSPVVRGVGYFGQVIASNTGSYGLIGGSFPPGLSFNSNGTITGTPTANGSYNFTYRAYGSLEGVVDANSTIIVNPPFPVFSDQTITTPWIKTRNFNAASDRTVAASDAAGYSIVASGSGLNPTGWLTINSSGQLSGLPTTLGAYTFVVRATNSISQSTDSGLITLVVNPPGNRATGPGATLDLAVGKRHDGSGWVDISTFKRFDGTSWIDITN
jgi:hypothetical protein